MLDSRLTSLPKTTLRADATPLVSTHIREAPLRRDAGAQDALDGSTYGGMRVGAEEDVDEDITREDQSGNFDDTTLVLSAEDAVADGSTQPTEEELDAARILLRAYRRLSIQRKRVRGRRMNPVHAVRSRVFADFGEASKAMDWPHRNYRMLFLGPIPHAVVCLQLLRDHLFNAKFSARKILTQAIHHDLEMVQARMTEIVYFYALDCHIFCHIFHRNSCAS